MSLNKWQVHDATNLSSAIRVYVVEHYRLAANASADSQRPG
jgi:predicted DNA-binding ribbon-helix-helix protein